jgi:hypothetical protein
MSLPESSLRLYEACEHRQSLSASSPTTGGRATHGESRLVVEDLLDAGDDLGGELGVDLESLEVLDDLLGLGGSELQRGQQGTDI